MIRDDPGPAGIRFPAALLEGRLLRRYQRFLAIGATVTPEGIWIDRRIPVEL